MSEASRRPGGRASGALNCASARALPQQALADDVWVGLLIPQVELRLAVDDLVATSARCFKWATYFLFRAEDPGPALGDRPRSRTPAHACGASD